MKLTDEGKLESSKGCETVTVVEVAAATVVPSAMEVPATVMSGVTPPASLKCKTLSWPSVVVAGKSVGSVKENTGVFSLPEGVWPKKDTTVPAGT
jgi:hypothetical protein